MSSTSTSEDATGRLNMLAPRGPWLPAPSRLSVRHRIVGVQVAGMGLAAVLGALAAKSPHYGIRLAAILAVGLGLSVIPRQWLPRVALLVVLLLPLEIVASSSSLGTTPVAAVVLVVWLLRTPWASPRPGWIAILAATTAAWVLFSQLAAISDGRRGMWLATLSELLPPLVLLSGVYLRSRFRPQEVLLTVLPLIACYAVVEKFLLHRNPLLDHLYQHGGLDQVWNSYRATTTLGHPLVNGTVFAMGLVLALDQYLRTRERPLLAAARAAVLALALVSTVSRGAMLSAAAGIALLLIMHFGVRAPLVALRQRRIQVVVLLALAAFPAVAIFSARDKSEEGRSSATVRGTLVSDTKAALTGHEIAGVGPGRVETYRRENRLQGVYRVLPGTFGRRGEKPFQLENSYAELVVDLGYVGLALYAATLASVIAVGLHSWRRAAGSTSALLTLLMALAGYNALGSHPQLFVLIALLAAQVLADSRPTVDRSPRPSRA